MCTITYVPFKNGYILTQNRDESPLRADAVFPVEDAINGKKIIFPKDPEGSGSWFVSAEYGLTICVMNGIYHANKKEGQFKHSRGLIPMHYLEFENPKNFATNYDCKNLEGFTLLAFTPKGVDVFDWDEEELDHKSYADKELIFQSKPLYNAEQKAIRQSLFDDFLSRHEKEQILDFHTKPQIEDPSLNILMDRGVVKSVSTVQRHFYHNINEVAYLKLGSMQIEKAAF